MWVGNCNLKTLFPGLYSLSLNQGQKVEEVGEWDESVWRWRLKWRRERFEWESSLVEELVVHISTTILLKEEKDVQVWGMMKRDVSL